MLAVLFVAGLIATSFWILWPFLPATIWATTLVVATWPIMLRVQRQLWGRRSLAVAVMTLALLVVFVAPFWLAVATIIQNFDTLVGWGSTIVAFRLPPPPAWLDDIPLFGTEIVSLWQRIRASGIDEFAAKAAPYAGSAAGWFVGALGSFGIAIVQLLLTLGHRRGTLRRRRPRRSDRRAVWPSVGRSARSGIGAARRSGYP